MDKFQNKYRIPSARAQWHGYDGGMYFVTICAAGKAHLFGEVRDMQMHLSDIGRIAHDNFANVSVHYPYAEIPLFTVMPNHIHAIVIINGNETPYDRRAHHVETRCATSLHGIQPNDWMINVANMQGWLSVVMGGLKSAITKYARQNRSPFAWQPRFYDRIIRSQDELNRIAEYIETNVAKWDLDELNEVNNKYK